MQNQKKLNEAATSSSYTIDNLRRLLNLDAELIDELGLIAQPKNMNNVPLAWDNTIDIEGNTVIIEGNAQPGGPESGTVVIKVPFDSFKGMYELRGDPEVLDDLDNPDYDFDEEDITLIRNIVERY